MPTGTRLFSSLTLRCALSVLGLGVLLTAQMPVRAAPLAYVANTCASSCSSNGTVSVIDTASDTVTATIPVGFQPAGVAVSPDGSRVYVADHCIGCSNNTASVIDTASDTVTATIPVGFSPYGVAVSPDGSRVFVTNHCGSSSSCGSNGTVSVIDAATDSLVTTITVEMRPFSLGASVGPGALIATNSNGSGVEGEQITGTVPGLMNSTGCATSDTIIQNPAHGSLVFDGGTGGLYLYSSLGNLRGSRRLHLAGNSPKCLHRGGRSGLSRK